MIMLKRVFGCALTVLLLTAPLAAAALQPPTGAARDGFVPLDSLPPQEQLPAAPLLITAYVFVWVLLMTYLWSIARRLGKVEHEMHTLQRRTPGSTAR
jgi:CcmD family protein